MIRNIIISSFFIFIQHFLKDIVVVQVLEILHETKLISGRRGNRCELKCKIKILHSLNEKNGEKMKITKRKGILQSCVETLPFQPFSADHEETSSVPFVPLPTAGFITITLGTYHEEDRRSLPWPSFVSCLAKDRNSGVFNKKTKSREMSREVQLTYREDRREYAHMLEDE